MGNLKTPWELFGIECGEGWIPLIEPVLKYIQEYNKGKEEEQQIIVYQIKEKFGALRIEVGNYPEELRNMVEAAENASVTICEKCGAPGSLRDCGGGWYHTLCDECLEKRHKI